MKSIINWLFVIAALSLSFVTLSCSKANYGCSKREERKSAKHFNKSVNWCQSEAMRQSLVHFPFKESDSTFVKVETIIDTFVHYDTLVINDTAFINASICTERYIPSNKPIVLDLKEIDKIFVVELVDM